VDDEPEPAAIRFAARPTPTFAQVSDLSHRAAEPARGLPFRASGRGPRRCRGSASAWSQPACVVRWQRSRPDANSGQAPAGNA